MDALTIIVPLVTAMLTAFVTHYLTKSHYEKKRHDDLADRDYVRRAAIHDMRIQDAREYVKTLHERLHSISSAISFLLKPDDLTREEKEEHLKLVNHIVDLHDKVSMKLVGIYALDDAELTALNDEILSISKSHNVPRLAVAIMDRGRTNADMKQLRKMENTYSLGEAKILELKNRIDELAKTVR